MGDLQCIDGYHADLLAPVACAIRSRHSRRIVMAVECPICAAELTLGDDLVQGELLECDECGTELEVESVEPLTLIEAPAVQEDWGQ